MNTPNYNRAYNDTYDFLVNRLVERMTYCDIVIMLDRWSTSEIVEYLRIHVPDADATLHPEYVGIFISALRIYRALKLEDEILFVHSITTKNMKHYLETTFPNMFGDEEE